MTSGESQKITRRDVDGILILDKPAGWTSNQALGRVKYLLRARKAGHTGSLDPLATGVLPLCFGQATKVSGWLLDADKSYRAEALLGTTTNTGDLDGEILSRQPVPALAPEQIEQACEPLRGPILQVPPMFSALKRHGRPLYEHARRGEVIEREPRPVTIHQLQAELIAPDRLQLQVRCSKGTYIRSLVEDLGQRLGCGATVAALRRTGHGVFGADAMVTLAELEAAAAAGGAEALEPWLLPAERALEQRPAIYLDAASARFWVQGQAVCSNGPRINGPLRVFAPDGVFLGVGAWDDAGLLAPRRLFLRSGSCS